MTLSYAPGAHFLVAVPGLVFRTADEHLARRVWSTIDTAGVAQDLLVELVRDGLTGLGAFVLVDARDDRVRVLVRGEVTARVHDARNVVTWSGSGVTTWAEKVFDRVDGVLIGDEEPSAGWLPVRAGIVRCCGFELRGSDMDRPEDPPSVGWPSNDPPSEDPPSAGRYLAGRSVPAIASSPSAPFGRSAPFALPEPIAPPASATASAPPDAAGPAATADQPPAVPPSEAPSAASPPAPPALAKPATLQVSVVDPEPEPLSSPVLSSADPAQTRTESPDDSSFDHLFESTIVRSVEDAAIRNVPDEGSTGSMRLGGSRPGAAGDAGPGTGAVTPAGVAETPNRGARLGDHDGHTITVAQLGALRGQLPGPEPVDLAPPPGARLELSTGDVVALDRDVVIGRRPEVDRVQGGRVPTVVTVPSPRQDVSRTHLQIAWSGSKVLATDLHSMNGTVLIGADGSSRALDGGVPHQLTAGDRLDIGDGITLTLRFLAP